MYISPSVLASPFSLIIFTSIFFFFAPIWIYKHIKIKKVFIKKYLKNLPLLAATQYPEKRREIAIAFTAIDEAIQIEKDLFSWSTPTSHDDKLKIKKKALLAALVIMSSKNVSPEKHLPRTIDWLKECYDHSIDINKKSEVENFKSKLLYFENSVDPEGFFCHLLIGEIDIYQRDFLMLYLTLKVEDKAKHHQWTKEELLTISKLAKMLTSNSCKEAIYSNYLIILLEQYIHSDKKLREIHLHNWVNIATGQNPLSDNFIPSPSIFKDQADTLFPF